ncbi:hypothetical protein RHGRI_005761 [Rhododendron griersonianum]|uniref:OTU domain-containing protein n=1 Tax=Rhododendron griersonianum TaxID=479676 RepID=A0AAV6LEC6_9ERIC|nr:hypothetical protein RHGRI_005761 [Rhododendron griersonianum]
MISLPPSQNVSSLLHSNSSIFLPTQLPSPTTKPRPPAAKSAYLPPTLAMETSIASSTSIEKQEIVDPSIHHDLKSEDHTMEVEKQVTDVVVTELKPQQEGDTSTLDSYVGPSTIPISTRPAYDYTKHFTTETFPEAIRPYIESVKDVEDDGNCGFRTVSGFMKGNVHEWLMVFLKKGSPMPIIACNWKRHCLSIAKNWDAAHVAAIQKFNEIIDVDVATKEVIHVN